MSDTKTKLGEFGVMIMEELKTEAKVILSELIEPVSVLKDYADVEVLTLDEAAKVLRREKQNLRDACARGEVPHQAIGRDIIFPKRTLTAFLMGEWQREEKKEVSRRSPVSHLQNIQRKVNA